MSSLTLPQLRQLISLVEKREVLQVEMAEIEFRIASALQGKTLKGPKANPSTRTGWRGSTKASILGALKEAGKTGVTAKDLSAKLGLKNQNVHVWFATTGKKIPGLKRFGPGRWALTV